MNSRQRRVRSIELSLTPREVVFVWLRNAMQAGTFEEGARHLPLRGAVANAVVRNVRESMKGEPEPLVERAILQASREADLLYLVVMNANMAVLAAWTERRREHVFLLGYLSAEINGRPTKYRVEQPLRLSVLAFLKSVILLDASISQLITERLSSQPVLFRDSAAKLAEQLEMATTLAIWFNMLAVAVDATEIDLEKLRNSLQSEVDRTISNWMNQACLEMLIPLGEMEETRSKIDQGFLLCESKSAIERK
jgi:hypothetical protein